jgi:8-oxo-dGTP diphosphatase
MPLAATTTGRLHEAHFTDVHVLVYNAVGKVLMSRRAATQAVHPGMWQLPSGLLEYGETATAGAARELAEETGITVKPDEMTLVHVMHYISAHDNCPRLGLFFSIDPWISSLAEPVNREPDKCDDWQWHPAGNPPHPVPDYLDAALSYIERDIPYSEYNWDATPHDFGKDGA